MSRYKKNKKKNKTKDNRESFNYIKTSKLRRSSHAEVHAIAYQVFGALMYTSEKNHSS